MLGSKSGRHDGACLLLFSVGWIVNKVVCPFAISQERCVSLS